MTRRAKVLEQMKTSPLDWRIENLKSVADAFDVVYRQPGGSHVVFRHPNGAMLSVPVRKPIKPVYIRKFVRLIEEGIVE